MALTQILVSKLKYLRINEIYEEILMKYDTKNKYHNIIIGIHCLDSSLQVWVNLILIWKYAFSLLIRLETEAAVKSRKTV